MVYFFTAFTRLLAGCEEAAVKPEKKVEPKQEEVAKQEEKR